MLGRLNATKKASATGPAPRNAANSMSRQNPSTRLSIVHPPTVKNPPESRIGRMSCFVLRGSFVNSARGYIAADLMSRPAVGKLEPRLPRPLRFRAENPRCFKCLEAGEFKRSRRFRHDFDLEVSDFRDCKSTLNRSVKLESEDAVRACESLGRGQPQ